MHIIYIVLSASVEIHTEDSYGVRSDQSRQAKLFNAYVQLTIEDIIRNNHVILQRNRCAVPGSFLWHFVFATTCAHSLRYVLERQMRSAPLPRHSVLANVRLATTTK